MPLTVFAVKSARSFGDWFRDLMPIDPLPEEIPGKDSAHSRLTHACRVHCQSPFSTARLSPGLSPPTLRALQLRRSRKFEELASVHRIHLFDDVVT